MLLKHWECAPMEIFFRRSSSFNSCSCSLSWIYLHKIFFQSISNDCFCFLSSKRLLWENAQKHENGRMYRFDYSFVARIEKLKSRKYLDSTYIMLVLLQYIYQLSTHRHKIWIRKGPKSMVTAHFLILMFIKNSKEGARRVTLYNNISLPWDGAPN